MYDEKEFNGPYTVLAFGLLYGFEDVLQDKRVSLSVPHLAEVTAVRVGGGSIESHLHLFIAPDGYDGKNILFEQTDCSVSGLMPEHLIGAPNMHCAMKELFDYIGDSVIIAESIAELKQYPFSVFKACAKRHGYTVKNAFALPDVVTALRLYCALKDGGKSFFDMSLFELADCLSDGRAVWVDVLADYDIYFDPDNGDRNDTLTWALMYAKLFTKLLEKTLPF